MKHLLRSLALALPLLVGLSAQAPNQGAMAPNNPPGNSSGSGTVTSVASGACLTGGPITTSGTLSLSLPVTTETTAFTAANCNSYNYTGAAHVATLPAPAQGQLMAFTNNGSGTETLSPPSGLIYANGSGGANYGLLAGFTAIVLSDGTNDYLVGGNDVTSFNTRTGAVTLTASDVTTALGYTACPATAQVTVGNANATIAASTGYEVFNTLLTAARTVQLPAASAAYSNCTIHIVATSVANPTTVNTLSVAVNATPGTDNINGGTGVGSIVGPNSEIDCTWVSTGNFQCTGPGPIGVSSATAHEPVAYINLSGQQVNSAYSISDWTAGAIANSSTATTQSAKDNSTKVATTAYVDAATGLTAGTSVSLTTPRQYFICTSTCTVTPPVPAAGDEFCVMNDDNVSTVITLAALGSSARYENTARTAYGTAGTGTLTSGGAVGDKVCILGRDGTHYLTPTFTGTWTAS